VALSCPVYNSPGTLMVDSCRRYLGDRKKPRQAPKDFQMRQEHNDRGSERANRSIKMARPCKNALASGEAARLDRSYQAENYYEVLSDAVANTVSSICTPPILAT
jgi:hypothetical protein